MVKRDFVLARTAAMLKMVSSPLNSKPFLTVTSLPSSEMNPMSAWTGVLFL